MEYKKKKNMLFRHLLNLPVLWLQFPILILFDISVEFYHQISFRLCGMTLVKRSGYFKMDRYKLKYLGWLNRVGCAYCSYANGLLRYASEIAARTEKYWCAIKHKKSKDFIEPKHHKKFLKYGDEVAYRKKYP